LKNQDKHPIDNYFKDNMEQNFPYKPSSWKKATVVIDNYFGKRKKSVLIVVFFLIANGIVFFFSLDSMHKGKEKLIVNKHTNKEIVTKNINTNNNEISEIDNSDISNVADRNISSQIAVKSNGTIMPNEKRRTQKASDKNNILNEVEQTILPISNKEIADSSKVEPKITYFTDFVFHPKLLNSFNFNNSNNSPQAKIIIPDRKKKPVFMLEVETLFSIKSQNKTNGLSQAQIDFKNKYETVENTNAYHLNLVIQRGKFGLITGLGYKNAIVKTNYIVSRDIYDTKVLYKTENSFLSSSGSDYLIIKTRVDTIAKRKEESKLENQLDQNTFEWLIVPLKLSYQYPYKRVRFSVRTGVDLSWLYNAKGSFINSDLESLNLVTEKELRRFNANLFAQFMTGYQINKKFQVGGSVYYSSQLGSNFKNYNNQFQNTGLGLYVRMGL
jgi:hypothetical protein